MLPLDQSGGAFALQILSVYRSEWHTNLFGGGTGGAVRVLRCPLLFVAFYGQIVIFARWF